VGVLFVQENVRKNPNHQRAVQPFSEEAVMTRIFIVTGLALGLLTSGPIVSKGKPVSGGTPQIEGRCPLVYAPVICDNGKTYPNPCYAEQHHAKNCVPTGL